ncbi:hypothetical protein [Cecembia calidifontis]|uniref:Uncharacterized protein n=1 Tax=Cecembia calidifontis TaxID=1187080 RepID=A0A4Q7P6E7_9BACT|nr:hypothetical protein [Cecembia calidifontis]RZS95347.1 hypothetical protein BC751_0869 [Cecembia calidifontis]
MKNLLKKANRGFYFRITDKITIEIAETQLNICLVNYLGQHCKGIIKLDLSTHGMPDPVCPIIDRMPDLKQYFIRIIDLGHGENPQMEQI